jgi:hypothetical protein
MEFSVPSTICRTMGSTSRAGKSGAVGHGHSFECTFIIHRLRVVLYRANLVSHSPYCRRVAAVSLPAAHVAANAALAFMTEAK